MREFRLQSVGYFAVSVDSGPLSEPHGYPTAEWLSQEFASLSGVEFHNLGTPPVFLDLQPVAGDNRALAGRQVDSVPASRFTLSQFRARIEHFYAMSPFSTMLAWIGRLNLSATSHIIVFDDIFLDSGSEPHRVSDALAEVKSSGMIPHGLAVLPLTFVIVTTDANQDRRERWLRAGADFVCDPVRDPPGLLFERLVERFQKLERLQAIQTIGQGILFTVLATLLVKTLDVLVRVVSHWWINSGGSNPTGI